METGVEKETPYQRKRKEANVVIRKLYNDLSSVSLQSETPVDYELVEGTGWSQDEVHIKIQVYNEEHPSHNKKIRVFAHVKGNGYWSSSNYKTYIRIDSDDWNVSFKKNWQPDTKDLVNRIHSKVVELIRQFKSNYEARVQVKETEIAVKELLANRFPASGDSYVSGNSGTVYTSEGKVQYNISYDTYGIELSGLTFDQLQRIREIKRETKDE